MKTSTAIIFAFIGALLALLPNYFGDLRLVEKLFVAVLGAPLAVAGIVGLYNLVANKKAEDAGILTDENIPFTGRMIAAAIGALLITIILSL